MKFNELMYNIDQNTKTVYFFLIIYKIFIQILWNRLQFKLFNKNQIKNVCIHNNNWDKTRIFV